MRRLTPNDLRKIIKEELSSGRRSATRNTLRAAMYGIRLNEELSPDMWEKPYTDFVSQLMAGKGDPKVVAFVKAGTKDGNDDDDKFTASPANPAVKSLKPTQNEIDCDKSLAFPLVKDKSNFFKFVGSNGPFELGTPIVTFNGQYVIDGHHRWSQLYAMNKEASISAIDLKNSNVKDPVDVLKAVQASILVQKGDVPSAKGGGTNLLDPSFSRATLEAWMMKKNVDVGISAKIASDKALQDIMRNRMLTEADLGEMTPEMLDEAGKLLTDYIWSNIQTMQKTSAAVPGSPPRDIMPQTDNVDFKTPLEQGEIDVADPHAPSQTAESFRRSDRVLMERWMKLAGILKG